MEKDWKVVYIANELYLAELALHKLRRNGIEAVILNKKDSTRLLTGYVEVMVERENSVAAEKLLKESES